MSLSISQYFAIILIIILKIAVVKLPQRYQNFKQLSHQLFSSKIYWFLIFLTHVAYVCILPSQIYLQLPNIDFLSVLCFLIKTVGLTPFTGMTVQLYVISPQGLFLVYFILIGGFLIQFCGFLIASLLTVTIFLGFLNFLIALFILNLLTIFIWGSLFTYACKNITTE